ncbi:HAD hydrolase-like protein [Peptacetobacter sp.]|uniref:HAD hydrolase-like protein n=1 Tax=Peptacetobacter sp. TaxID=2991975 RepID=UPI00260E0FC5|nr:HAD hydrolase-like protein [Peptacetobacter sp.]
MKKIILFDLDGTLTESGEGIINCVRYALEKMGKAEKNIEKLKSFIGPPLVNQFMAYSNMTEEEAEKATKYYRERFSTIGIFENKLYPNIETMLKALKEKGFTLSIASSKPEKFVRQILSYFKIDNYFDEIVGATLDGKISEKADVIFEALKRLNINDENKKDVLMVGDKEHDIFGARLNGLLCVAVSYGYGSLEELEKASPLKIVNSVDELKDYLLS